MIAVTHREPQRTYELPDGAEARVDWGLLEGYTVTEAAGERRLEAVYYDTADLALQRHRTTLRRRRGGADDGWRVKLRDEGGHHEARFPLLAEAPERLPDAVRHLLDGLAGGRPMHPVATLRTTRRVLRIIKVSGAQVGELIIDDVEAVDHRTSTQRARSELEVHLVDGTTSEDQQHRVFTAVEHVLFAAGGRPSASRSGTPPALEAEHDVSGAPVAAQERSGATPEQQNDSTPRQDDPGRRSREAGQKVSGAELLVTVLGRLAEQLVLWDLKVRLDVPDAVHQLRVTSRSMRSLLKAAAPFFDGATAPELDVRLRELARALSGARDAEVTAELLPSRVEALGGQVDPVAARALQHSAEQQAAAAAATVRGHLSTRQHLQLLADVRAFAADPPLTGRCQDLSADEVADSLLRRALRKVVRVGEHGVAAEESGAETGPGHRLEHLHEVRKAVKRVRYVHAILKHSGFVPGGSSVARAAADAKKHQEVLGEIMDAGVVAGWLERTAQTCRGTGQDRYALGLLHGAERAAVRTGVEDGHEVVAELLAQLRWNLS